jgi:thymidine phosphorylase
MMVAKMAKAAGCPTDTGSGVYLYKHVGECVVKGEKLFTVYAENDQKKKMAKDYLAYYEPVVVR